MITGSNNPFDCIPAIIGNNNKILTLGTITRVDNTFTFSVGFSWLINNVEYQNTVPFDILVTEATTGFKRIDNVLLNTSNEIVLQQGLESDSGIAQQPVEPSNTIILSSFDVDGATIADNTTPIVGDLYLKKKYLDFYAYPNTGVNQVLPLRSDGIGNYTLTNSGLVSVSGFDLSLITGNATAESLYLGKEIMIWNKTSVDVTLVANESVDLPFLLDSNLTLPNNEKIIFFYDGFGFVEKIRSFGKTKNNQIFNWWGGNWNTSSLNLYYYIGYNGGAIETNPGSAGTTAILTMQGRNKGLFVSPFDCKIKRVIFKEGGSGSYTGKFALASGLPYYGTTWSLGYTNTVVHIDNAISSSGYWTNKFEFVVTDDITVPKGYIISPLLMFSAQAQASKVGIEISIEIEEVL